MDTFINSASTPEWWISVVFVGIAINLFSSGIKTVLQKQFSYLVKKWAERNETLSQERTERINRLVNSNHELYLAHMQLNKKGLDSLLDWVFAAVLLGFGAVTKDTSPIVYSFSTIFAMLSAMQGLLSSISYWQESLLVQEAKFENIARIRLDSSVKPDTH